MDCCLDDFDCELSNYLRSTNPWIVPKQCCHNSLHILKMYPQYNFVYVEGYAVLGDFGLVVEHGWLELGGRIVDVTLPGEVARYFAIDKFTPDEASRAGISECYVPEWHERCRKDASLADHITYTYTQAVAFAEIMDESN